MTDHRKITQAVAREMGCRCWVDDEEDALMNPDHAKRVLEHQDREKMPLYVIARSLAMGNYPSPRRLEQARQLIKALVDAGYAIEPIEDENE